jgi:4'-phosphopantetheinyl transferase
MVLVGGFASMTGIEIRAVQRDIRGAGQGWQEQPFAYAVLALSRILYRFVPMQEVSLDTIAVPTGAKVHIWQVACSAWNDRLPILESILSGIEVARANRFLRSEDRDRYVCAHGVLRRILGSCFDCRPESLIFGSGPHGKPFVNHPTKGRKPWRFNLSHSGDRILVAVTSAGSVGVDVERLARTIEIVALSRRFFSRLESEFILALPPSEQKRAFIDTWVCKEAFIKAVGEGLSMPLDSFAMRFDGERTAVGPGDGKANPHLESPWSVERFDAAPGYLGAVAVPAREMSVQRFDLR